jgi:signal transduction histidine kinase
MLLALRDEDIEVGEELLEAFLSHETFLHEYTIAAKDEQSAQDLSARKDLFFMSKLMAFLGIAAGFASLTLAALFFIDSRQHRRIAEQNADLLVKSQLAYKAKSQFLSTVSHELRTPLTSIKGAISIIKGGAVGDFSEKAQVMLRIAHENSNRLSSLINDILDVERTESTTLQYKFDDVEVSSLINESIEANQHYDSRSNINFKVLCRDNLPSLHGDRHRLIQVLSNVISNAIKYSRDGGTVTISANEKNGALIISVEDNGCGIPQEFQDQVFDKFTQADSSDTRKYAGTGLGMFIARTIVENHGGRIYLDSKVDQGTVFFIEFPIPTDLDPEIVAAELSQNS